jgi:hypothetical protein
MAAPSDPPAELVLTLQLLDTAQGFPIQSWKFPAQPEVRIGRANDNDVIIPHPYVSRLHVRLLWREGDWELVNVGTHGTLVAGRAATRALVSDGDDIRLGPLGPTLRVRAHATDGSETPRFGTLMEGAPAAPAIRIDPAKKEEEVRAVADDEFFRRLQERLQALRARRS